ncbi:hypothetical protein HU001_03415 [Staphylococcus sp. SS21]|nr:hypothetical protein [Staphylococcus singaporensis]
MRVSAENPAFGTPLIGFPEHKNFMSQPLIILYFNFEIHFTLPSTKNIFCATSFTLVIESTFFNFTFSWFNFSLW